MGPRLRVITYNIRKGKGAWGRSTLSVDALGRALSGFAPDVVLCQEVFHSRAPGASQSHELAQLLGLTALYEPNKHRKVGHHGNATFTRHPIAHARNYDVSTNLFERRGVLYAKLSVGGHALHVLNAHLGLSSGQRLLQARRIGQIVRAHAKDHEPVLLAGDFNDWHGGLDRVITEELGFTNALAHLPTAQACTWHAARPFFNLDRVYLRNVSSVAARRLEGAPWHDLSDHLPVSVELELAAVSQAA